MKRIAAILSLLALTAWASFVTPQGNVSLQWDYDPIAMTNMTFNVYGAPDLTQPTTNWNFLTNVFATNVAVVHITPGRFFFFVTASNYWGESGPSNVINTSPLPTNVFPRIQGVK